MQRSRINHLLRRAKAFFLEHGFHLPPFAFWGPEEWKKREADVGEIRRYGLGWDITDFGLGDFRKHGLLLFTLRNGPVIPAAHAKSYAEKIMIVEEGQVTPMHFHWHKMEDIINRGGGDLVIKLANATEDEKPADTTVTVTTDGLKRTVDPGDTIRLQAGESITLTPMLYHAFWSENGRVLVGEVSKTNDDRKDNRFLDPVGRFPEIEEDEPPLHLLCHEYPG